MYACNCCMFALLFVCRCIAQIQLRGGQGVEEKGEEVEEEKEEEEENEEE